MAAGWIEEEGEGASHAAVTRLASVAARGGFLFGYDSAVINGVLSAIQTEYRPTAAVLGLSGGLDGEAVPGCDCGAGSSSSTPPIRQSP